MEGGPCSPRTFAAHASKCTQVAGTFPPGKQRDMFSDIAKQWIRLAAKIESLQMM